MKKPIIACSLLINACLALLSAGSAGPALAATPEAAAANAAPAHDMPTDRLIVKYKDGKHGRQGDPAVPSMTEARQQSIQRIGRQFGLSMRTSHAIGNGAQVVALDRSVPAQEARDIAAQIAAQDADIDYAEPDLLLQPLFVPNDPRYAEQWGHFEVTGGIGMPDAWDHASGTGTTVAVLDSGYRPHAELSGRYVQGHDFISSIKTGNDGSGRDSDASDPGDWVAANECGTGQPQMDRPSSWHGMRVAGVIAALANNGVGMAGVAYGSTILPVRVLGKCGGYLSDIADGIIWAAGGAVPDVPTNYNKARVINLSLGIRGSCSITMQSAIDGARARGAVVVAATGNENRTDAAMSPANCAGVIGVTALNRAGARAWYANYGTVADIAAPGGDMSDSESNGILSTTNTGTTIPLADGYAHYEGTSLAVPHVAGAAALMLSKNPWLSPDEVESRLRASARAFPVACSACGAGIVDAGTAVNAALRDAPAILNESEPNDSVLTNADAIASRKTFVNGNIVSLSDMDYFKLSLPAGATLSAILTPGSSSADYNLYVYSGDARLTRVARSENGPGAVDSASVTNSGTAAAVYYVRVTYASGGSGATRGKYSLKLSW